MNTLIIIDAQNDFMPGGALPVNGGDEIIPLINRLQQHFDLIIATQDWHPHSHLSFASNHHGKKLFDTIDLYGMEQVLWPDHCIQQSAGADFHPDLDTRKIEVIFRKGMDPSIDSYSGFYDNGHRKSTGLGGFLRGKEANMLAFCGLAADFCVYFSMKDAVAEGFKATLIEDATRPIDQRNFDAIRRELPGTGVDITSSAAILQNIRA
ncbi:MAG TPA: bifunctional nicotinamidase/pyrazinamidase [Sphingobacteriaceae bacterium]